MEVWSFFDYINANDENVIREWMEALPVRARAAIDTRLRYLAQQAALGRPHTGNLGGGVFEIPVEKGNVQYRPLFAYGPRKRDITLLVGATKTQGKSRKKGDVQWSPRSAVELARARKLEVDAHRAKVVPHEHA